MLEKKLKKSIFKKLLFKLTKGCVFSVTEKLLKQDDGCPMGGPISVVFSDIFMCKILVYSFLLLFFSFILLINFLKTFLLCDN